MDVTKQKSITFASGRTFTVGDTVEFSTRYGSRGTGKVVGFGDSRRVTTIKIAANPDTIYGPLDSWPLKDGGKVDRILDPGLFGGEII